jgi:hypothetical protein
MWRLRQLPSLIGSDRFQKPFLGLLASFQSFGKGILGIAVRHQTLRRQFFLHNQQNLLYGLSIGCLTSEALYSLTVCSCPQISLHGIAPKIDERRHPPTSRPPRLPVDDAAGLDARWRPD